MVLFAIWKTKFSVASRSPEFSVEVVVASLIFVSAKTSLNTNNSPDITMDSTSLVREGMSVTGTLMSSELFALTITNSTTVRLSANVTTTDSSDHDNTTLTFGKPEIDERYQRILIYYPCWRVSERLRDLNLISY